MSPVNSIISQLSSVDYSFAHYYADNKKELESNEAPIKPVYTYETTSKVARIASEIFNWVLSFVFLPYGIYRLLHWVAGRHIVPAQTDPYAGILRKKLLKALLGTPPRKFTYNNNNFRKSFMPHQKIAEHQQNLKEADPETYSKHTSELLMAKRISVVVDGKKIDAMMFGKKGNLNNKKWVLVSNGNGSTLESTLAFNSTTVVEQVNKLGFNFLIYNYQGIAGSEGWVTRNTMVNTHRGMLRFLEDNKRGIGAKKIIQLGVSIGGGVQGQAMRAHKLLKSIKYVFVKYLTFSCISKVPRNPILALLLRIFGWEFSSTYSSKRLEKKKKPEIVIQKAQKLNPSKASMIEGDGLIHKKSAHAYNLLSEKTKWKHKKFIGVSVQHFETPKERIERDKIINTIKESLSRDYQGFDMDYRSRSHRDRTISSSKAKKALVA